MRVGCGFGLFRGFSVAVGESGVGGGGLVGSGGGGLVGTGAGAAVGCGRGAAVGRGRAVGIAVGGGGALTTGTAARSIFTVRYCVSIQPEVPSGP